MKRGNESEEYLLPATSLWVVVARGLASESFELDGERRRALVVGSCIDADIRLNGPRVAPVECFFVRDGDEVRLVPACATSDLRVGSVVLKQPMRLWRKTSIEVGGIALEVRIREEPPTSPDNEIPVPSVSSVGMTDHVLDGPPSSTAPAMVSVRAPASLSPAVGLEQLGLLARRRPGVVALGSAAGAAVLAISLHFGAIAVGAATHARSAQLEPAATQARPAQLEPPATQARPAQLEPPATQARPAQLEPAAPLSSALPFCGIGQPSTSDTRSLRRAICDPVPIRPPASGAAWVARALERNDPPTAHREDSSRPDPITVVPVTASSDR